MRKEEFMMAVSRGLARLGGRKAQISRATEELADHWDELAREAQEGGLGDDATAQFARERIGEPDALIQLHAKAMRHAHWSGRHPVVSFIVLPPILLLVWFMGWLALAAGTSELCEKLLRLQQPVWTSYLAVLIVAKAIQYTGVVAVPAFLWWWARRSFCGSYWGWIGCGMCALNGLINQLTVKYHSLSWSYGLALPTDWLPIVAPLVVAALAHQLEQRRNWRAAASVALGGLLLGGCASPKVPQQRGWIGGQYKQVKVSTGAAILVTDLSTNTPAARSGLQEGDVILEVAGERVRKLEDFRETIDAAAPGARLPVTVLRDGAKIESQVAVGRETFEPNRAIAVGFLFSHEWDPWPNPDFSLVALGYKRQHKRVEFASPEARFELAARGKSEKEPGLHSSEGWEVWLPVCSFSWRKRILSQSEAD